MTSQLGFCYCFFQVCSKPMEIAEKMMQQINERLKDLPRAMFLIVRLCELLGCMAVKLLGYLDNSVYRELKRRNYLREERKKENKNKKNGRKSKKARKSILETSVLSESSVVSSSFCNITLCTFSSR